MLPLPRQAGHLNSPIPLQVEQSVGFRLVLVRNKLWSIPLPPHLLQLITPFPEHLLQLVMILTMFIVKYTAAEHVSVSRNLSGDVFYYTTRSPSASQFFIEIGPTCPRTVRLPLGESRQADPCHKPSTASSLWAWLHLPKWLPLIAAYVR